MGHAINATLHAKGTLDAESERRLEELPGWTWDPVADQWEEGFSQLLEYVERHGDARVPQSYTVDGYQLGKWVKHQRYCHRKGTLDADRQRRLQKLPGWTWDPVADRWEEAFTPTPALRRTPRQRPRPLRPTQSMATSSARWVEKQRVKHAKGILDADREQPTPRLARLELGSLRRPVGGGFPPTPAIRRNATVTPASPRATWSMATSSVIGSIRQRHLHTKGTLDADRERRLQDLPGWTWKASSST